MARAGHVDMTGVGAAISRLSEFRVLAKRGLFMRVMEAKRELIDQFTAHPVTQEIDAGPNSENISSTLGGPGSNSNLFTFIGFGSGDNPTAIVKEILEDSINIGAVDSRGARTSSAHAMAQIVITYPTARDLKPFTPMPWEPGRSWLQGIEDGISGFGEYMRKKFDAGRSKWGLQAKHKVRGSAFRPVPYYTALMNTFTVRVRRL